MASIFTPEEANSLYEQLPTFARQRNDEITEMAKPYITVTDSYARLIARVTFMLGHMKPTSTQDRVIRDLMADVFDFLYEARVLILQGKLAVAYPLARRAYESLSLLHLFSIDSKWAEKWDQGKKIENQDVRRQLAKHPHGEPEEELRALYKFFSLAAHPNRDLVADRLLGDGNEFVLGVIGVPELVLIVDYCTRHLGLWFWFAATITYFYREQISAIDPSYGVGYLETAREAQAVKKWLIESQKQLRAELLALNAPPNIPSPSS